MATDEPLGRTRSEDGELGPSELIVIARNRNVVGTSKTTVCKPLVDPRTSQRGGIGRTGGLEDRDIRPAVAVVNRPERGCPLPFQLDRRPVAERWNHSPVVGRKVAKVVVPFP